MNTAVASSADTNHKSNLQTCPVYDINLANIEDKSTSAIYFIMLACKVLSVRNKIIVLYSSNDKIMEARLPVKSQLNVCERKSRLANYWDQQLLQWIEFGFPLDFNRNYPLKCEGTNHLSAVDYLSDVGAYIKEETEFNAILGPFHKNPIEGGHCSPFITRHKPNSDRRRVIIDLNWPQGASVNSGINKNTYLDSQFDLTFPSVDDITNEVKHLGRGALLYKVDVSHAFRQVKVDPGDYNLLGLEWNGMCLPFRTWHRSQIFQRISDAVRFLMRQAGFYIINYIDDYIEVGVTSIAQHSFDHLLALMKRLGLSVS